MSVEDFKKAHSYPDTDQSAQAIHHTLGGGPNQAAPGWVVDAVKALEQTGGPVGPKGTRWGTTPSWALDSIANVDGLFYDGMPARVGDLVVSTNGIGPGTVYRVSNVHLNGKIDMVSIGLGLRGPTANIDALTARVNTLESYVNGSGFQIIGASGKPAFENSWQNYTNLGETGYEPAGYVKRAGFVIINGLVKLGTANSVIFTLPLDFRPAQDIIRSGIYNLIQFPTANPSTGTVHTHQITLRDVSARINIFRDGKVVAHQPSGITNGNGYLSLDGIVFAV